MNEIIKDVLKQNEDVVREGAKKIVEIFAKLADGEIDAVAEELAKGEEMFADWQELLRAKSLADQAARRTETALGVQSALEDVARTALRIIIAGALSAI